MVQHIANEEWTEVDKLIDDYLCECYEKHMGKYWKPLKKEYAKIKLKNIKKIPDESRISKVELLSQDKHENHWDISKSIY